MKTLALLACLPAAVLLFNVRFAALLCRHSVRQGPKIIFFLYFILVDRSNSFHYTRLLQQPLLLCPSNNEIWGRIHQCHSCFDTMGAVE